MSRADASMRAAQARHDAAELSRRGPVTRSRRVVKGRSVSRTRTETRYVCEDCGIDYASLATADACCVCRDCGQAAPRFPADRLKPPLPASFRYTLGRHFADHHARGLCRRCTLLLAARMLRASARQYREYVAAMEASADEAIAALGAAA